MKSFGSLGKHKSKGKKKGAFSPFKGWFKKK